MMTYVIPVTIALLGAALWAAETPAPTAESKAITEPRVAQIAEMLGESPAGLGRPADDRVAWATLAKNDSYQAMLRRAEGMLKQPIPPSPDELFLDYSKTGNRGPWERVAGQRRGRIGCLTIAECLEDKGRFVPALAEAVASLCQEKTWLMPAHDGGLANFKGTTLDIDLGSSALSWNLAMADWLLGKRLPEATRQLIGENLRRRTLDPFLDMAAGKRKPNWWVTTTNNWNAVCLAGVTGTALAVVAPRAERARFVAAAEAWSRNFLAGFTPDGYCSEGLGYWDYGFGNYVMLSETIRQATGGKLDLLARPEAKAPATFPARIEIINGISPAFADCSVDAKAPWAITHFLNRRFGQAAEAAEDARMIRADSSLAQAMIYSFPNAATQAPPATAPAGEPAAKPLRDYFPQAGILICRPGPAPAASAAACHMGVALKGGHNDEHHNHNDVGSYVVVLGHVPVLLDPGAEVYTARTFSSRRYDSNVLNSFGHAVPRVAGKLQQVGRQAAARIVRADFTDAADTYVMDIRSAYPVPELRKLQRTFVYSRAGAGSLTVTDEAELTEPREFETALITLGQWKQIAPTTLLVADQDETLRVEIDASGAGFDIHADQIKEDMHTKTLPTRIGIRLKDPVAKATITVRITPDK
jgi:hypothetical protein